MINTEGLTYCGEQAGKIFSQDLFALDLRGYGITYMDGVKGKKKIYNGSISDVWQKYTCAFTPEGDVVLGEDYIEPNAIKVNIQECYDQFWDTYLVEQTEISLKGGIPQTFAEWYFAKLREKMSAEYQEMFWKGDKKYAGQTKKYLAVVDGVEKILADSNATKITGAAFSVDNAVSQIEAVITAGMQKAAAGDIDMKDWKVFVNHNDFDLLKVALGKICCTPLAGFSNYAIDNGKMTVFGFEIVPTMQTRGTVIFGPARNLVLGYDTYDSHLEYRILDMKEHTGDNAFRVIALSNIAVGIVNPDIFVISKV